MLLTEDVARQKILVIRKSHDQGPILNMPSFEVGEDIPSYPQLKCGLDSSEVSDTFTVKHNRFKNHGRRNMYSRNSATIFTNQNGPLLTRID